MARSDALDIVRHGRAHSPFGKLDQNFEKLVCEVAVADAGLVPTISTPSTSDRLKLACNRSRSLRRWHCRPRTPAGPRSTTWADSPSPTASVSSRPSSTW